MYHKILVPLDGSELAECVLPHVESIAKGCGVAEVLFVRVAAPVTLAAGGDYTFSAEVWSRMESENKSAAENYLNQLASRLNWEGVSLRTEVLFGSAADSIADYATENKVDLIAIATHGRSGITRWIWGSVAGRILRSASVPVLVVRAPGSVSGI